MGLSSCRVSGFGSKADVTEAGCTLQLPTVGIVAHISIKQEDQLGRCWRTGECLATGARKRPWPQWLHPWVAFSSR